MLNNLIKGALSVSAVSLTSIALPTATYAQTPDVIVTAAGEDMFRAEVSYAGVDLGNPVEVARVERRLAAAIDQVCPISNRLSLVEVRHGTACRLDARQQASAQLDQAIARARSGQFAAADSAIRITAR